MSPHLNAKEVYKVSPGFIQKHQELRSVRDSFLNHPGGTHYTVVTLVASDSSNRVTDTPTITITQNVYGSAQIQSLLDLVLCSREWIASRLSRAMEKSLSEAQSMNLEELDGPYETAS